MSGYFSTGGGTGFWLVVDTVPELTTTINDAALPDGATCDCADPLDTFHLDKGCALALEGSQVVATMSGVGRWLRRVEPSIDPAAPLPSFVAQAVGAAVVVSFPFPDSSAANLSFMIAGLCSAGVNVGSAFCGVVTFAVKKGIGVGSIALVGAPSYLTFKDAPYAALVFAASVNVGTGRIELSCPCLATDTIDFSGTVQMGKVPR